jgi:hypothetical protein
MLLNRWQRLVTRGLRDEDEHQDVANAILLEALYAQLGRVHERLEREALDCGLPSQRHAA